LQSGLERENQEAGGLAIEMVRINCGVGYTAHRLKSVLRAGWATFKIARVSFCAGHIAHRQEWLCYWRRRKERRATKRGGMPSN
jgi:hypothetical protein